MEYVIWKVYLLYLSGQIRHPNFCYNERVSFRSGKHLNMCYDGDFGNAYELSYDFRRSKNYFFLTNNVFDHCYISNYNNIARCRCKNASGCIQLFLKHIKN